MIDYRALSDLIYRAAAEQPLWVEVPATISSIITAAGLIVAGTWAYVRFARGRILHASCKLGLSARKLTMYGDTAALKITATIENSGGLRLLFPASSSQTIAISEADPTIWEDAVQNGEVLWSEGRFYRTDILTHEGAKRDLRTLEPGEQMRRFILVPLADHTCTAYRISMYVEARPKLMWRTQAPHYWETELMFGAEETDNVS